MMMMRERASDVAWFVCIFFFHTWKWLCSSLPPHTIIIIMNIIYYHHRHTPVSYIISSLVTFLMLEQSSQGELLSLSLSISFPFSLYTSVSILLHQLFIIGLNYALYAPDDLNCYFFCFFYLYQIGTFDTVKLQSHFRGHECFCSNIYIKFLIWHDNQIYHVNPFIFLYGRRSFFFDSQWELFFKK